MPAAAASFYTPKSSTLNCLNQSSIRQSLTCMAVIMCCLKKKKASGHQTCIELFVAFCSTLIELESLLIGLDQMLLWPFLNPICLNMRGAPSFADQPPE